MSCPVAFDLLAVGEVDGVDHDRPVRVCLEILELLPAHDVPIRRAESGLVLNRDRVQSDESMRLARGRAQSRDRLLADDHDTD